MNERVRSKRWLAGRQWLVAAALLCAACACDRNRSSGAASSDDATTQRADVDDAEQIEGVGRPCETPEDCDSFLTCRKETCQTPPAVVGEADESTPNITFVDQEGDEVASYHLELAVSESEKRKGLMFRREMADGWGMLFVYDRERPLGFWMKNTFLSLDMVFINGDGEVVRILEEVEPLTRTRRRSKRPARYALELEAGTAREDGLERGMTIELSNVEEDLRPDQ
ncbi:MAG: DUF192 domain-containing protein [Persicimonas sp.]